MKRLPLVALAAIVLGALAWGCSDRMNDPTTPLDLDSPAFHHAPGHDKGGGGGDDSGSGGGGNGGGGNDGGSTTAALTGAMATSDPTAQPVKGKENKRSLNYSTDQNAIAGSATLAMDFSAAAAAYAAGDCSTNQAGNDEDLAAQLTATASPATIEVNFDKTADDSASSGHGVTAHYGDFRIGLPPHRNPVGTIDSDDGATITMTFTGGDVRVWRISDDLRLFCPNAGGDAVTVTLVR